MFKSGGRNTRKKLAHLSTVIPNDIDNPQKKSPQPFQSRAPNMASKLGDLADLLDDGKWNIEDTNDDTDGIQSDEDEPFGSEDYIQSSLLTVFIERTHPPVFWKKLERYMKVNGREIKVSRPDKLKQRFTEQHVEVGVSIEKVDSGYIFITYTVNNSICIVNHLSCHTNSGAIDKSYTCTNGRNLEKNSQSINMLLGALIGCAQPGFWNVIENDD